MIKTVGDLRKILNNLDDDYKLDIRIMKEIPEEELAGRSYPYPWNMIDGYLEFQDIDGKKHTLKFSYESWALEFQKWFEKHTYEKENVEL